MNGLVPQKWHEVFGSVLAKKPDDRYQTATEFVQDLEYCLGSWFGAVSDMTLAEPAPAVPAPAPPGARKDGAARARVRNGRDHRDADPGGRRADGGHGLDGDAGPGRAPRRGAAADDRRRVGPPAEAGHGRHRGDADRWPPRRLAKGRS